MSARRQGPTISIVVAVLNEAPYIRETLESVLDQDYPNLEIHVQDGGSTDGTLEILRSLGVHFVSEPDAGVPDAFNRGIRATSGELVMVADDPLLPGALTTLSAALKANPDAAFAYGDVEFIDASGRAFDRIRSRSFDLDELFWGNHVATQSVLMRRSALVGVGLYRTDVLNADWDLWLRMGARHASVYVPALLARYRVHEQSTTLRNMKRFAWSMEAVADHALEDPVVLSRLRKGRDRAYAGSHLTASALYVYAGDWRRGMTLFARSIRRHPRALLTRRGAGAVLALSSGRRLYGSIRNRGRGRG